MSCDECVRALSEGDRERARKHAQNCPACAALMAELPPAAPSPAVQERLAKAITRDLAPVRPLPGNRVLTAALVGMLALAIGAGVWVAGSEGHDGLNWMDRVLLYVSLAIAVLGLSASLPQHVVPGARRSHGAWLALAALAGFALTVAVRFPNLTVDQWLMVGLGCFGFGSVWGLATALAIWWVLRRGVVRGPLTGALLGLLGAIAGLVGLTIHCPVQGLSHVMVWHLAALALPTLAGAALGVYLRRYGFSATSTSD